MAKEKHRASKFEANATSSSFSTASAVSAASAVSSASADSAASAASADLAKEEALASSFFIALKYKKIYNDDMKMWDIVDS